MSRDLSKILAMMSVGAWLCLILGNVSRSGAAGNTPTPTPLSVPVVLIFTQSSRFSAPRDELTFTIRSDGTTTLTTTTVGHSDNVELWQQLGTISSGELATVKVLVLALSGMMDQAVPDLTPDFTFEFPQPAGSLDPSTTKTVHVSPIFEHIEPENQAVLKNAIQTLSDMRKASEPLVIFGWSGGFASSPLQLFLLNNGAATYVKRNQPRVAFVISDTDRLLITQLIQDPAVQNQSNGISSCEDCYIFTLSFMTANDNFKTVTVNEADLENAPEPVQTLVSTLKGIAENRNNEVTITPLAQTTQTLLPTETLSSVSTPTLIPPFTDCCTEMIAQGNFMRRISVLGSEDMLIGAARRLQLHPNEPPTECVVLIMTGPLSYDITIFDGYWIQIEKDATTERISELTAAATKTIKDNCGEVQMQIIHVP